jgi:hypothetical protein
MTPDRAAGVAESSSGSAESCRQKFLFRFRNKISECDGRDQYSRITLAWHATGSLTFFWGL